MENVKICEIRNGINSNYPHLISPDEKYLFCCLHKLGNYKANDKVYCIDRSRNKAFFTGISGEEIQATYNSKDGVGNLSMIIIRFIQGKMMCF